jgi:hypothetical protein
MANHILACLELCPKPFSVRDEDLDSRTCGFSFKKEKEGEGEGKKVLPRKDGVYCWITMAKLPIATFVCQYRDPIDPCQMII